MQLYSAVENEAVTSGRAWRLVTDQVMGGLSQGRLLAAELGGRPCQRMHGEVSTANNGGFVQIALDLADDGALDATGFAGLEIEVFGNGEHYNAHLRSADTRLPWQAYRARFLAEPQWHCLRLPFAAFEPHRIDRPLRVDRLRRLGLVAIGRPFQADLGVARVALYRAKD
ncbi:CIA30 family protein [Thiocystis violacea]|uniref:CIA30 family protein n=1 Tax=Thiocystis violacea TaxID=13725 RepID=UPI001903E10D|nr:CIA30 family protein [Thiocystis violacea]MBK1722614.1 CIA30 family protein [Thiocystis violacea]